MKRYARNLADEGYPYKLIREYKALLLIFSYAGGGWMQETGIHNGKLGGLSLLCLQKNPLRRLVALHGSCP